MSYPALPDRRMAYDRDGSVGFQIDLDSNLITQLDQSELEILNNESMDQITARQHASHASYTGIIFPEPRDITHYFLADNGGAPGNTLQTSDDTTTGLDGTWTTQVAGDIPSSTQVVPYYRTDIQAASYLNITAIRFVAGAFFDNDNIYAFHLYGDFHDSTLDRLLLWDSTLNQPLDGDALNFGNSPRSSSADKAFRVKNASDSKIASSITVAAEVLTETSPTLLSQLMFSTDGMTYTSTASIGSLGPGAISDPVFIRRTTPSNAQLGLGAFRVTAEAATFAP